MKKSIIFAAALAASTVAFAQSNVTLYGVADVGAAYSKDSGTGDVANTVSGVSSSLMQQSFIGVKGSETLGGGTRAIFAVEQGFDTSGAGVTARNQFVGIAGKYGTVKLGRLESSQSIFSKRFDAMGMSAFSSQNFLSASAFEYFSNSTASYQGQAGNFGFGATYSSDGSTDFTGVTNKAAYGNGVSQERVYTANADYTNGGFAVGYVYTNATNTGRGQNYGIDTDGSAHQIGASYDFKVVKLVGSYKMVDADVVTGNTDLDQYNIGVQVPVGSRTRIDAGYTRTALAISGLHENLDGYGIQVAHNLSTRTALYSGYKYTDAPAGMSSQIVGAGIRHAF